MGQKLSSIQTLHSDEQIYSSDEESSSSNQSNNQMISQQNPSNTSNQCVDHKPVHIELKWSIRDQIIQCLNRFSGLLNGTKVELTESIKFKILKDMDFDSIVLSLANLQPSDRKSADSIKLPEMFLRSQRSLNEPSFVISSDFRFELIDHLVKNKKYSILFRELFTLENRKRLYEENNDLVQQLMNLTVFESVNVQANSIRPQKRKRSNTECEYIAEKAYSEIDYLKFMKEFTDRLDEHDDKLKLMKVELIETREKLGEEMCDYFQKSVEYEVVEKLEDRLSAEVLEWQAKLKEISDELKEIQKGLKAVKDRESPNEIFERKCFEIKDELRNEIGCNGIYVSDEFDAKMGLIEGKLQNRINTLEKQIKEMRTLQKEQNSKNESFK